MWVNTFVCATCFIYYWLHIDPGELSESGLDRMQEEVKFWSNPHVLRYFAQPFSLPDGNLDIMRWSIGFPGVKGTPWEDGYFRAFLKFYNEFPKVPPICRFGEGFYHPNISADGRFLSPFLSFRWDPQFRIETVINIVRDFIHTPRMFSALQQEPLKAYVEQRTAFYQCVRTDAEMRAYNVVMPPF